MCSCTPCCCSISSITPARRWPWARCCTTWPSRCAVLRAPEMRAATLKRFLREDGIEELLELARLDALSSSGDLRPYEFCCRQLAELGPAQIAPPRLLSREDALDWVKQSRQDRERER